MIVPIPSPIDPDPSPWWFGGEAGRSFRGAEPRISLLSFWCAAGPPVDSWAAIAIPDGARGLRFSASVSSAPDTVSDLLLEAIVPGEPWRLVSWTSPREGAVDFSGLLPYHYAGPGLVIRFRADYPPPGDVARWTIRRLELWVAR